MTLELIVQVIVPVLTSCESLNAPRGPSAVNNGNCESLETEEERKEEGRREEQIEDERRKRENNKHEI